MNLGNLVIGRLSAHLQDLGYSGYFSDFLTFLLITRHENVWKNGCLHLVTIK